MFPLLSLLVAPTKIIKCFYDKLEIEFPRQTSTAPVKTASTASLVSFVLAAVLGK